MRCAGEACSLKSGYLLGIAMSLVLLARPGHAERFERARAEVMRLNQDGRSGDIQLESVTKLLIGQQLSVFRRASTGLWQYADRCTVRAIAAPSVTVEYEQTKPLLEDLIIDWPLVDASGTERGQVYPFAEDAISLAAMLQAFRSGRSSERTAQWSLLESDRLLAQYLKVSELRANSTRLAALSADLRRQSEALAKLEQAVQKAQQDVVTLTQEEAQAKKRLQEHADRLLKAREQVQMVEEDLAEKRRSGELRLASLTRELEVAESSMRLSDETIDKLRAEWREMKRSDRAVAIMKYLLGETDELFGVKE